MYIFWVFSCLKIILCETKWIYSKDKFIYMRKYIILLQLMFNLSLFYKAFKLLHWNIRYPTHFNLTVQVKSIWNLQYMMYSSTSNLKLKYQSNDRDFGKENILCRWKIQFLLFLIINMHIEGASPIQFINSVSLI